MLGLPIRRGLRGCCSITASHDHRNARCNLPLARSSPFLGPLSNTKLLPTLSPGSKVSICWSTTGSKKQESSTQIIHRSPGTNHLSSTHQHQYQSRLHSNTGADSTSCHEKVRNAGCWAAISRKEMTHPLGPPWSPNLWLVRSTASGPWALRYVQHVPA